MLLVYQEVQYVDIRVPANDYHTHALQQYQKYITNQHNVEGPI